MSKTFTDTERLDWLLSHSDAEFDSVGAQHYVVFWLGPCAAPSGTPGKYIASGASPRECIDSTLEGRLDYLDS